MGVFWLKCSHFGDSGDSEEIKWGQHNQLILLVGDSGDSGDSKIFIYIYENEKTETAPRV